MPAQPVPAGKVRYTVVMDKDARADLIHLTEKYDLSQTDILEAMVAHAKAAPEVMEPVFKSAREHKVTTRMNKRQVVEKLSKLDPDKLAALLAQAEKSA